MRYLKIILTAVLLIVIVVAGIFVYNIKPFLGNGFMPNENKIEKILSERHLLLSNVLQDMIGMECDNIGWDAIEEDKIVFYLKGDDGGLHSTEYSIYDLNVSEDFKELKDSGFVHVLKKNNYIKFVKWSSLDSSCGLLYCDDIPDVLERNETEIKEIEDHWYYFKHVTR